MDDDEEDIEMEEQEELSEEVDEEEEEVDEEEDDEDEGGDKNEDQAGIHSKIQRLFETYHKTTTAKIKQHALQSSSPDRRYACMARPAMKSTSSQHRMKSSSAAAGSSFFVPSASQKVFCSSMSASSPSSMSLPLESFSEYMY